MDRDVEIFLELVNAADAVVELAETNQLFYYGYYVCQVCGVPLLRPPLPTRHKGECSWGRLVAAVAAWRALKTEGIAY